MTAARRPGSDIVRDWPRRLADMGFFPRALLGRRGMRQPGPKIFIIGPSKCATTALHRFFADQGLDSVHCRDGRAFLAVEIESRKDNPAALKAYLDRHTVFSDMVYAKTGHPIDASRHFQLFQALYPDAYFIFNDRDEDDLIRSIARHKDGSGIERRSQLTDRATSDILGEARQVFRAHKAAVLAHFAGHERFLHFRVDRHPISDLVRFLAPSYHLSEAFWARHNVTGSERGGAISGTAPLRAARRRLYRRLRLLALPLIEIEATTYAQALLLMLTIDELTDLFG